MNDFLIAIVIGIVAGLIDVTPMIIMKLEKAANISAFVHYFFIDTWCRDWHRWSKIYWINLRYG